MIHEPHRDKVLALIQNSPGLTDREIAERLDGKGTPQQETNQVCRSLENEGLLVREKGRRPFDNYIGNYPVKDLAKKLQNSAQVPSYGYGGKIDGLSEDEVKQHLFNWLTAKNWRVEIAWGKARGIDVVATKESQRWLIEAKGAGSRQPMRVNYFIGMLGELLQRMEDNDVKYSISMPDMKQFRGLWERLPKLAKERTKISALFVSEDGKVEEIN